MSMAPGAAASEPLPPLREDLVLLPASANRDGSPAWMIQDPVTNRFFRIGWLEFEFLVRWQASGDALLDQLHAETPLAPDEEALAGFRQFLEQNSLVRAVTKTASERLAALSAKQRRRDLRWLIHHYLFIRIPLVRPERFLNKALPLISFVYTRTFALIMLALTVAGVLLASRQWDTFVISFRESLSPGGAFAYLIALGCAKLLHELGHAFTATRYGVRVAHMGISLVVMFPMLYTDTSESWKLTHRRQRLAIVAAGILTELGLAGIATLAWSLVPDGPTRSALFFLATTSWILSLGINASPFMRFDGYFIASDLLDLPNLHARSSAFARAFLRRKLLGWREPDPEVLPPELVRLLTGFAFATWIYRLIVFIGIALLVYLFFFKALGIILFAVEIAWFIVMPVWAELKVWWSRRTETPPRRRRWGLGVLASLLLLSLIPLPYRVDAPAWIHAEKSLTVYSPYPARIVDIRPPGPVEEGDVLLTLDSPDTTARSLQAERATATIWSSLQRASASDEGAEQKALLSNRLRQGMAERQGALEDAERLIIRAPFSGRITDHDPLAQGGVWVSQQQPLGVLVGTDSWIVEAYVDQLSVRKLRPGSTASIYPAGAFSPLRATIVAVDDTRTSRLPDVMLDAEHGGPIRVSSTGKREVLKSLYRVRLQLDAPPALEQTQLATASLRSAPHSLAAEWFRRLASLIVRESSF